MLPFLNRALALAARALKFARSVPLRLGFSRVPRTCYGFCVRRAGGATTPLVRSIAAWASQRGHTLAAKARLMP